MNASPKGQAVAKPKSWALTAAGWIAATGLAVAFIGLTPSCSRLAEGPYGEYAHGAMAKFDTAGAAERAPPLEPVIDGAGQEVRLADLAGKPVLVNLWATWCAPCVEEMPTLAALQRAYPERLLVLPVSADRPEAVGQAKAMLAKLSDGALAFHHDDGMRFTFAAQAKGFPTTILYGADGREIGRLAGSADWASPEARALIEAALAG